MTFIAQKKLGRNLDLIKEKAAELKKLSGNIKINNGAIDFENRIETIVKLHELKAELTRQKSFIDSTLKRGVKNISSSRRSDNQSIHGAWGNMKGKFFGLKSDLTSIEKHIDFLISVFSDSNTTTNQNIAHLVEQSSDYNELFQDNNDMGSLSAGMNLMSCLLILLLAFRSIRKVN